MLKTTKVGKVYFVMGHAQTGSGTLTYPEDFDEVGVFHSPIEASDWCNAKNLEIAEKEGIEITDKDDTDEVMDALMDAGAYWYSVSPLNILHLGV